MDTEKVREVVLDYIHLLTSENMYDYHTDRKIADARLLLGEEDTREVTVDEMLESFSIKQRMRRETAWAKDFELSNGYRKEFFAGRLMWDENYGYEVIWDTDAPKMADRPEFEYVLDSILEDRYNG
jgi:hypothetical protein